jgi:hypothetical protein
MFGISAKGNRRGCSKQYFNKTTLNKLHPSSLGWNAAVCVSLFTKHEVSLKTTKHNISGHFSPILFVIDYIPRISDGCICCLMILLVKENCKQSGDTTN